MAQKAKGLLLPGNGRVFEGVASREGGVMSPMWLFLLLASGNHENADLLQGVRKGQEGLPHKVLTAGM